MVPTALGFLLVRQVIGDEEPSSEVAANEKDGYSDRGGDADSTPHGDIHLRGHRQTVSVTLELVPVTCSLVPSVPLELEW